MGQKTGAHGNFVGKLGRVKCRWDNDYYNGGGDGGDADNRKDPSKKKQGGKVWSGFIYFRTAISVVDIYQYDNEFIRCGYFLN